jgi:hypothetical protein
MSISTKILIILGAILTIGALSFIIYKQNEISTRQTAIENQVVAQKELMDGIVRSSNTYATSADIEKFITANNVNLKAIKDDLSRLNASVTAVNAIIVSSSGQHQVNVPNTSTGPTNPNPVDPKNPDPYGYQTHQENLDLAENFGGTEVPIGNVGFSAWQKAPWTINVLPRDYHVTTVIGTDENQRTYVYNKFGVKVGDKEYDVKIAKAETKQEYPTAKFSWFNPRLMIGSDVGVNINQVKGEFAPSLNIGIMSYGQFLKQPDWSIIQVGVGAGLVSQKPQFSITPFAYNVGKNIPLMNNMYIGPSLHVNTAGDISVMGGIRVGM